MLKWQLVRSNRRVEENAHFDTLIPLSRVALFAARLSRFFFTLGNISRRRGCFFTWLWQNSDEISLNRVELTVNRWKIAGWMLNLWKKEKLVKKFQFQEEFSGKFQKFQAKCQTRKNYQKITEQFYSQEKFLEFSFWDKNLSLIFWVLAKKIIAINKNILVLSPHSNH